MIVRVTAFGEDLGAYHFQFFDHAVVIAEVAVEVLYDGQDASDLAARVKQILQRGPVRIGRGVTRLPQPVSPEEAALVRMLTKAMMGKRPHRRGS